MSTAPPEWVVEATRGFVETNGEAAEAATYYRTSQAGVWDAISVGADPSEAPSGMEWLRDEDTHVVVVTGDFTIHRVPPSGVRIAARFDRSAVLVRPRARSGAQARGRSFVARRRHRLLLEGTVEHARTELRSVTPVPPWMSVVVGPVASLVGRCREAGRS
jgi:hypothetical protein